MIFSADYVSNLLNLAALLCSLNFLLSFKQISGVERVLHFPINSRCQSSSESHWFLENVRHIVTSSPSRVFFSAPTSAPGVQSENLQWITRWVAAERAQVQQGIEVYFLEYYQSNISVSTMTNQPNSQGGTKQGWPERGGLPLPCSWDLSFPPALSPESITQPGFIKQWVLDQLRDYRWICATQSCVTTFTWSYFSSLAPSCPLYHSPHALLIAYCPSSERFFFRLPTGEKGHGHLGEQVVPSVSCNNALPVSYQALLLACLSII